MEWAAGPEPGVLWDQHPAPAVSEALAVLLEAREQEQQLTTVMLKSIPEGARLHGLEFRVKSPASLARKIADRMRQRLQSAGEAAGSLADLVRYTAVCSSHDDVVGTAASIVEALGAQGFEVREVEHSYVEGNTYRGLHLQVAPPPPGPDDAAPAGPVRLVEVQVHSELSQAAKDEIHADYEIERNADVALDERAAAHGRMVARSTRVPVPRGLAGLLELGGVRVTAKSYPNRYGPKEEA